MKIARISKFLSIMMFVGVAFFGTSELSSSAAKPNPQTPEQTLSTYFYAEKVGDVDLMANLTKDTRFNDVKLQKADYQNSHDTHPLLDYRFTDKQKVSEDHYVFTVVPDYSGMEPLPGIPFPVVREQGQWKVLLEPIDINFVKDSPDYGKVTKNNMKTVQGTALTVTQGTSAPEATDVLFYSFYGLGPATQLESYGSFTQTRSDGQVTINGWQEAMYSGTPNLKYEIFKRVNNITTSLSQVTVSGTYLQSGGSWFSRYMTGVPKGSDYKLKISNISTNVIVDGAGNLYL